MNKIALVTGASSGIGKAIATLLIQQNYTLYAVSRSLSRMKDLHDAGATTLVMDVTKEEEINKVINCITSENGKIDVLVNNAGYGQFGTIEETSSDKARAQFETNVFGLANVTRKALPLLRKGTNPKIINISSIAARVMMPGGGWYSASKHAVSALSEALRFEVDAMGIKVSIIEPGPIKTNFGETANASMDTPDKSEHYKAVNKAMYKLSSPSYSVGVAGTTDDVTKTVTKILQTKNPRTRYLVTPIAWWLNLAFRILPDNVLHWGYKKYLKSLV